MKPSKAQPPESTENDGPTTPKGARQIITLDTVEVHVGLQLHTAINGFRLWMVQRPVSLIFV